MGPASCAKLLPAAPAGAQLRRCPHVVPAGMLAGACRCRPDLRPLPLPPPLAAGGTPPPRGLAASLAISPQRHGAVSPPGQRSPGPSSARSRTSNSGRAPGPANDRRCASAAAAACHLQYLAWSTTLQLSLALLTHAHCPGLQVRRQQQAAANRRCQQHRITAEVRAQEAASAPRTLSAGPRSSFLACHACPFYTHPSACDSVTRRGVRIARLASNQQQPRRSSRSGTPRLPVHRVFWRRHILRCVHEGCMMPS